MREIKFRAYGVREKRILGWDWVQTQKFPFLPIVESGHEGVFCSDDYIPMQFTGLLDKNGKEIYEGDIIGTSGTFPSEVYWMGVAWGIRWKDDDGAVDEQMISDDGGDMEMDEKGFKHMEVVGNIHENQDLLK